MEQHPVDGIALIVQRADGHADITPYIWCVAPVDEGNLVALFAEHGLAHRFVIATCLIGYDKVQQRLANNIGRLFIGCLIIGTGKGVPIVVRNRLDHQAAVHRIPIPSRCSKISRALAAMSSPRAPLHVRVKTIDLSSGDCQFAVRRVRR